MRDFRPHLHDPRTSNPIMRLANLIPLAALATCVGQVVPNTPEPAELSRKVEIIRTAHGVPHIYAHDVDAAAFGEAWVQSEDYGSVVALSLLRARGEMGRYFGRDSMRSDFTGRIAHERAVEVWADVDEDTRAIYEGFAAGVNFYIAKHPEDFPSGFHPAFTGYDVLAKDVEVPPVNQANAFLARIDSSTHSDPNDGSNAWAFNSGRTTSGHAILLRNPHLAWTAGYYEAHIVVEDDFEFYGDLRIGGPFTVVAGFNRDLGWATTNNDPILWQIYALDADPANAGRYLLDGKSHAVDRKVVRAEYRTATGAMMTDSTIVERTSIGVVIARRGSKMYVFKAANDLDYRAGEQFLAMMRAHSLAQWKEAMRMRARINSSFTYADHDGNAFYVWNASLPSLPHWTGGGDTVAIPVHRTSDAWSHLVPWDSLPQFLNPPWGYVQNENDAPYYTNMYEPLDPKKYPAYFPPPKLGLRSQLAIQLVHNNRKLSIEDVIALKHSYRMLLADRVRDDLVAAVRATNPGGDVREGIDVIAKWDKTAAPDSRGGTLFEAWWRRYAVRGDTAFAQAWDPARPLETPRGLRDPRRAAQTFVAAVADVKRRFGALDVAWGDVHRVRRGDVDVPVGGCASDMGCFRVLTYAVAPDGKFVATGSDGWILAVEFGDTPRAYSVLAYGESPRRNSPWFSDQAAMFARGELKPVLLDRQEIEAASVRRYRPGE
jgi:acyl-homoserine-lactone acylase